MLDRKSSTFSSIIRTALLLASLMWVEVIIANPRDSHSVDGSKSSTAWPIDLKRLCFQELHKFAGFDSVQSRETFSAAGRVIDAVTAQPIAGAHFVYGQPANSTNNGGFVSFAIARANSAGEFRVDHLKPGRYALYISASLDRSDLYSDVLNFDVVDADVANLEVQARHGSRLSGFVVPAGVTSAAALAGLSSVKVVAAVPSIGNLRVGIANVTAISPDGSFQFMGLRPGKAFINLKADNESLNGLAILRIERNGGELKQGIEIKPGEEILDLRIMIADGTGGIRGQVEVEGGTLPAGARMVASI